ncbi:MAG: hypothetical protein HQM12_17690 [SAR324 cluster bacterium]|nr:hypothetical protein [SAR324 cluster bacterium]MBF0350487.1 hypothetical protein [SAR324 cluster bacterium]
MKTDIKLFLVILIMIISVVSCSDIEGTGMKKNSKSATTGMETTTTETNIETTKDKEPISGISWEKIYAAFLSKNCVSCHNDASPASGLSWTLESYDAIVTAQRKSSTTEDLIVKPFDPENSFVIKKLKGLDGVSRMPLGGPYLEEVAIQYFEMWIADGALRESALPTELQAEDTPLSDETAAGVVAPSIAAEPTWDYITKYVLGPGCQMCHSNSFNYKNLSWSADRYDDIVARGRRSSEVSELKIVEPFNKDKSYLYLKLIGSDIKGSKMPGLGIALPGSEIENIGKWIDNGALPSVEYVSWDAIEQSILRNNCSGCHNKNLKNGDLNLDFNSYKEIVTNGKKSSSGIKIVEVGNKEQSMLYKKIKGEAGKRMPLGSALSDESINLIGTWIDNGAKKLKVTDSSGSLSGIEIPKDVEATIEINSQLFVWSDIQKEIFQKRCVVCHNATTPASKLSWTADQYETVLYKQSATGELLIKRGDGISSYLVKKLKGMGSGNRMPLGGPYLTEDELNKIVLWIDSGANE